MAALRFEMATYNTEREDNLCFDVSAMALSSLMNEWQGL